MDQHSLSAYGPLISGKMLLQQRGLPALFVGVVPRLLQQVQMLTNSQQFLLPQAYTLTTEWSLIIIITQTCTSQVPSSTICWYGVEATQKALEP